MKIYQATYNDCVYESAYGTISLHKTYAGAGGAIEQHKQNMQKEFDEWNHQNKIHFPDDDSVHRIQPEQDWEIFESELLEI